MRQGTAGQRAVVGRNRVVVVTGFVPLARILLVGRDVTVIAFREEDVLIDLHDERSFGRGRLSLGFEIDVGRTVSVEVVFALGGDVEAQQRLREGLALFPADEVVVTVALLKQFNGALAADFEQYAFVRPRHVGVACLRGRKVRVGVGVGVIHVQIGHTYAIAQFLDRQIDVGLRQRTQLGFGFGVVEVDLGRADDRQVGVREVVPVGTEIGGSDELDGLIARHAGRQARHFDLGGVDGLLHISEMSWGRTENPKKVYKVGDSVKCFIKEINGDKIALSVKYPDLNPWNNAAEKYAVGNVVKGTVARMTDFGAFVQLEEGVDALLHVSQISRDRIEKPSDALSIGQEIEAKVVDLNEADKKISLSIKALLNDNEAQEEAPATEE